MVYRYTGLQPNVYRRGLRIRIPVYIQLVYTGIQVYRSTGLQVYSLRIPQVYSQEAVYGIQSTVYTEYTGGIQLLSWYKVYSGIQVYSHPSVRILWARATGLLAARCGIHTG